MAGKKVALNTAFQEFLNGGNKSEICKKYEISKKQLEGKIYRSKPGETKQASFEEEPMDEETTYKPVNVPPPRVDYFLESMPKSKDTLIDELFPDLSEPSYDPNDLLSHGGKLESLTGMSGKSKIPKGFFSKEKKVKPELSVEEKEGQENERLALIQKIRLYLTAFPDLTSLPVVRPDKDKYLISLYSRKQLDLEKELNFFQFHVRNSVSENSGHAILLKSFETAIRTIEVGLSYVGLRTQGLTNAIMADADLERCIKEICIEHSISTFSYGPKVDLFMKIGSAIVKQETINRSLEYAQQFEAARIEKMQKVKASIALKNPQVPSSNTPPDVVPASNFSDL